MACEAPLISVLMGVYNCEKTLDESLRCLEAQTEKRWECIICDDGSADRSAEIISEWQRKFPGKYILLRNSRNKGLAAALNRCLAEASGEFIARMDGDDLCSPERFEKELRFLRDHPEYAVVSTDMQCFDENGVWGFRQYPTEPGPEDLVKGTPFCHAACMVRRDAMLAVNGYSESEQVARAEDYNLWVRMYEAGYRGGNIHEPLYQMRDDRNAAVRRSRRNRLNEARVRLSAIKRLKLPLRSYVHVLRPLVLGLLPNWVYHYLHRKKLMRGSR